MIDDYLNLITSEHATKPKFIAWLTSALSIVNDIQNFLINFYTNYDLDTAVGVQLDALGVILNRPRLLPFQPSDGVSALMDDTTYRLVLKSTIAEAQFDGTAPGLYGLFQTALGNTGLYFYVQDNQDMSLNVIVYGVTTSIISDLISHGVIVPRPEGVNLIINITSNKIFTWGLETEAFGGWGEGYWLPQGVS
jgi:hypothetical protein